MFWIYRQTSTYKDRLSFFPSSMRFHLNQLFTLVFRTVSLLFPIWIYISHFTFFVSFEAFMLLAPKPQEGSDMKTVIRHKLFDHPPTWSFQKASPHGAISSSHWASSASKAEENCQMEKPCHETLLLFLEVLPFQQRRTSMTSWRISIYLIHQRKISLRSRFNLFEMDTFKKH